MSLPSINTFSPSTTAESAKVNDNFTNLKNRTDIAPTTADHITLTAGTNKLVRTTVLRQDDTTNTYASEQVILTGWGKITGDNSSEISETVTFGITFATAPIVIAGSAGLDDSGGATSIGDFTNDSAGKEATTSDVTTTNFLLTLGGGTLGNGTKEWGYTWIAIGTLS